MVARPQTPDQPALNHFVCLVTPDIETNTLYLSKLLAPASLTYMYG
jgi:hypothetical protein